MDWLSNPYGLVDLIMLTHDGQCLSYSDLVNYFSMAAVTNYHKLLKLWLETMEIYCLTVLEARSSASVLLGEIKVSLGLYSLWRLKGRICSLPLPVFLIHASISWFVDILLQGLPSRSHCLFLFLGTCQIFCSFLIWIHTIAFGAQLNHPEYFPCLKIHKLITRQTLFCHLR